MRLDFRILWIDDQQKHVNSFAEGLQFELNDLGFELDVIRVESLDKVQGTINEHVHGDGIDLVLVDFDLGTGNGDGGAEALLAVRKRFPYKEIIFYSALDTKKLRKIAFEAEVDGIILSTRLSLVNDTTQVIQNLLRRVMDIDHMRGVVMSATSDIDFLVEKSLHTLYERMDIASRKTFCEDLIKDLNKKLTDWSAELAKAAGKSTLLSIIKLKHIFSAIERVGQLNNCLSPMGSSASIYQSKIDVYCKDIVPRRNKLAHVIIKKENDSTTLCGLEKITEQDLASLRRDLIEHRKNFNTIAVLLDVKI